MNSPSILKTTRRSRGYRSLSNEISNETDTELPTIHDTNNNNRNTRRTSTTSSSMHFATNLVYNLLSPKYSPVFRSARFKQKSILKETNKRSNRIPNLHSSISSETSSLESLDSLSSTDLLPSVEVKKHSKKVIKQNDEKDRIMEEQRNNSYQLTESSLPGNNNNNEYNDINGQQSLNVYEGRKIDDCLSSKPTNRLSTSIRINNKNHENSGAVNKIILNLPINRIKKDHLCTTQSAPCSPIFMKKEHTTPTHLFHTIFNSERSTSPYLKKKQIFQLNPVKETTISSSNSLLISNVKNHSNGNLLIKRNKSYCQKTYNNNKDSNNLNNLPLSQLELNIQQFKSINKKLDVDNLDDKSAGYVNNNNNNNIKGKALLDNDHFVNRKNEPDNSVKRDPKHYLNEVHVESAKRIETPPPSYSDLTILNESNQNHLISIGNNNDSLDSNYSLLSKIDEQLNINQNSKYAYEALDKSKKFTKQINYNINNNCSNMTVVTTIPSAHYSSNLSAQSSDSTDQDDSYRKVVLQRHDTTERFGMRLERTKGIRQVTYIAMILPKSPAQLAGLKVGDRLIRVNELETDQMLLDELLNYIRKSIGPLYLYYQTRPFTSYLLTTVIRKQNGKIGIKLKSFKHELRIDVVLPNSPASRVGLRSGQQVVSLNGQCVHGWDQLTAMHWFRHYPDGVDLTITVLDELDKAENTIKSRTAPVCDFSIKKDSIRENYQNGANEKAFDDFASINLPLKPKQTAVTQFNEKSLNLNVPCGNLLDSSSVTPTSFISNEQESHCGQEKVLNPLFLFTKHEKSNITIPVNTCQSAYLCTLDSCPLKREDKKFYIPNPEVLSNDNAINHSETKQTDYQDYNIFYSTDHNKIKNTYLQFTEPVIHQYNLHNDNNNNSQCSLTIPNQDKLINEQNLNDYQLSKNSIEVIEADNEKMESLNIQPNDNLFLSDSILRNDYLYKTDCV
ncbi:unnamed protein product [Schistosoma intercalatum]|nr:unnamed protein product [Schistosoma intercalatum]